MPWLAGTGTAGATGVTGVVGKFSPTVMTESARVPATSLPTDLRSALRVLNEARARAASVRERFAIGLQMVEVCLAHKRHDLARPLLAQLEQAAKHHDLEVWEPALAGIIYVTSARMKPTRSMPGL